MCNILLNHRKRYRKAPTGRCPSLSELTLLQQIAHIFSYLGHISIPKDRCHWFGSQQNHQPFACPPPALLDSGRLGTELGEFQFKLKYRLVASQKTGLATPSPPLQDSTTHPYRHPVPRQSSAAAVVNPTSQLATMWPVQERPVSPSLDLQRSSIWPMLVPTALASARNRGAKLIPGRNTPSPRPAQRGARNDEESKIHGEFLSETVWGRDRGYRLGPYFHADVPQPGIEYEHSPTGRIYRCPGQRESEIIRSLSPPPNHIISLSQCHAYDHAVIVSHHVTAEHRAQALNESKALPPTSHRLPQSAPNETVPLTTLHRGRVSKTEYNNLNPSLRILICILRKMMKDTPMHRIVNRTTMRHLVAILSLKEYTQIPEQVSNNHDKANLLEFATYIWIKGSLRRTRLQDADRRIRCLISRLGAAVTIIPDVLCVHCREVTQERETFASGAYADVFRGTYRDKQVAVRRPRRRGLSEDQCREVLIWSTLAHKNILPFIGAYTSSDGYLITISPLMENGTLLSWRKKSGPSTREIEQHLREVAEGLNYLHNEGVLHGDLHGNNVLLDSNFRARLADFGLSQHLDAAASVTSISAVSHCFSAPELFFEDNAKVSRTDKTDTFAFACLYYQIHFGFRPFEGKNRWTVPHKVKLGGRARRLPDPPMDDRAWALINSCWQQVPTRRPTMHIVLKSMRSWHL